MLSQIYADGMASNNFDVQSLALALVPVVLWILRWKYVPVGVYQDLVWVALFTAWYLRQVMLVVVKTIVSAYFYGGGSSVSLWVPTLGYVFYRISDSQIVTLKRRVARLEASSRLNGDRILRNWSVPATRLRPMLFPSQVFHKRKFPKEHSFSYSYLMVGIPVGWRGSIGTLLSADIKSLPWQGEKPPAGWFTVESADHLARGDSLYGLRGKLEEYLASIVRFGGPQSTQFVDSVIE